MLKQPMDGVLNGKAVIAYLDPDIQVIGETSDFFVHPTAIIDTGARIGPGTRIWHFTHVCGDAQIGARCSLGQNVMVARNVVIGEGCKIQNNVSLYEGVYLEDYVFCGPSMVFTNVATPRCLYPRNTSRDYVVTRVRRGASIGANATIVCGHTVGEHALIGAGSVVTRDIPAYAMVYGNPAQIRGWACECGLKLSFQNGLSRCEVCARLYRQTEGIVKRVE